MNPLEKHLAATGLNETTVLNRLQDHGVVSDLCVTAGDVAPADCARAVKWLTSPPPVSTPKSRLDQGCDSIRG